MLRRDPFAPFCWIDTKSLQRVCVENVSTSFLVAYQKGDLIFGVAWHHVLLAAETEGACLRPLHPHQTDACAIRVVVDDQGDRALPGRAVKLQCGCRRDGDTRLNLHGGATGKVKEELAKFRGRVLTSHVLPVALPGPEEQAPASDNVAGRPASGPVVPLNATIRVMNVDFSPIISKRPGAGTFFRLRTVRSFPRSLMRNRREGPLKLNSLAATALMRVVGRVYVLPRLYLTIAVFAVLTAFQPSKAQEILHLPALELPKLGVAEAIPKNVMPPSTAPSVDALSAPSIGRALGSLFKDSVPRTRGAPDVLLFKKAAPSVVLILRKDGAFGSGSLLNNGNIISNRHVVGDDRQVTVVFKPSDPSGKPKADEVVQANVIKLDVQRDLALLRPTSIPTRHGLEISTEDSIDVGTDVVAIGHPTGKDWTFTKGIVSAFRPDYEWSYGPNDSKHIATVIQTQTPLSPGSSGGPLLTEDGQIVGVNSFITSGAEGLNFAIAAKEIRFFLVNPNNGMEAQNTCTEAKVLFEGRNNENTAFIRTISLQCDDKVDVAIIFPDNKHEAVFALVYSRRQDKPDGLVLDPQRSGKWTISFWDVNRDGTYALQGLHPDGKLMPSGYVPRCGEGGKPVKDFKCA